MTIFSVSYLADLFKKGSMSAYSSCFSKFPSCNKVGMALGDKAALNALIETTMKVRNVSTDSLQALRLSASALCPDAGAINLKNILRSWQQGASIPTAPWLVETRKKRFA